MKGRFLLDIIIGKGTSILELLTSKDKTLLIWGNTFLILNLLLDIVNAIRGLHLKSDGLARKSFYENLYNIIDTNEENDGKRNVRCLSQLVSAMRAIT